MDLSALALFAVTEFVLSLTPGPAVLLVMSLSMRSGFRAGFMATLGILATNAVFFTLSALGVGALIIASATLFTIVKWVGAAYLIYLGIGMVWPLLRKGRRTPDPMSSTAFQSLNDPVHSKTATGARAFWKGFALQASNPKNIAFFVAILPQFIDPTGNVPLQLLVLGVVSVLIELPILMFYAAAFTLSARIMKDRVITWIEAIGGGILVMLGVALARTSRDA
ncbi:LysE family translocator [Phaeobacter inhibens]|uniref:LysE family translocator n=1 Tax=Phaeobacter inhibens TaxID=221822 RepID=UPI0021A6763B|nr:LysE family translocator [Phaeobacter inhibens]UWR63037.1 LysE family translocator [Phaeobacter inhibens]UWR98920.1 LysE family translocator [Phaeobacter inhibens]UWS02806.1 LysE family translocator [Phaeobacter inhibens]